MKPTKPGQPNDANTPEQNRQMGQASAAAAMRPGSTTAQLKHDINSGLTGDKVNFFDPAAAPLGTDDEAGGYSPTPEQIHEARMAERSRPMESPGADSRTPPHGGEQYGSVKSNEEAWTDQPAGAGAARWVGYLVAAAVIALLIYMIANP